MPNLEMSFDPHTIEHLGVKMYKSAANAIAELVANAYDADASEVHIRLYDKDEFKIVVSDDGVGMTFDEINDCFLKIGRKRRNNDNGRKTSKGRVITGKKGLGKLALFGIGKNIKISTTKADSMNQISFSLNWDNIMLQSPYQPPYAIKEVERTSQGTIIELSNLKRKTPFDIQSLADSISRLFNFINNDFKIKLSRNGGEFLIIDSDDKYNDLDIQFSWNMQELCNKIISTYPKKSELKGKILSTKKPVSSNYRGITLYANGRLVNTAGFFGKSEAPIALSYITGYIEADFIDEENEELISTDRQSLNWDTEETQELQKFLQTLIDLIIKEWNAKRKQAKTKQLKEKVEKVGLDIEKWKDTMPFDLKHNVEKLIDTVVEKEEIDIATTKEIVTQMQEILPPYPLYHFRHLHKEVKSATESSYKAKNYYEAFLEASKRYDRAVAQKSGISESCEKLMTSVFSENNYKLDVTAKFASNEKISQTTLSDIKRGHFYLSRGVVAGGRNILAHEEFEVLREVGLFSEKDCLDLLSLLSHLFKRLEESELKNDD